MSCSNWAHSSETVTVAEAASLLSSDATLGAAIPQTQVANLPLSIHNWDDLLALVPGVQATATPNRAAARLLPAPATSPYDTSSFADKPLS